MTRMDNGSRDDRLADTLEQLVAENRLMREQVSRLIAELRDSKQKTNKRVRTVQQRVATELIKRCAPTEQQIERARQRIESRRRS